VRAPAKTVHKAYGCWMPGYDRGGVARVVATAGPSRARSVGAFVAARPGQLSVIPETGHLKK
jgi:hypothetical protein